MAKSSSMPVFTRFPARCPSPGWPSAVIDARSTEISYSEHSGPLTIKCVFAGEEEYQVRRLGRVVVRPQNFLVLNHGQSYSSSIRSATAVESFAVFLAADLVADVGRTLDWEEGELLDDPEDRWEPPRFAERLRPSDRVVTPALVRIRDGLRARGAEEGWLEEQLCGLVERLLPSSEQPRRPWHRLPAARASTRRELYRRLVRAREFLDGAVADRVTLGEVARVACLSPHHLLRSFQQAFGLTPHGYLSRRRLERAKELLRETDDSVSAICSEVGFESLGSFSFMFRRAVGAPPSAYRRAARAGARREVKQ